ncbi:MAG: UDP-N-acetylglucosamine 2-epimerase (non-hydrolyzing) [bacterium]
MNDTDMQRVILVAGARPNFMKVAPVLEEMKKYPDKFVPFLVHTGQHYDENMSKVFFRDLGLPEPDVYLGVGSASHAVQTARIMMRFEEVVKEKNPDIIIVVGDVNSTLACALIGSKLHIPVAHIEAGLRSYDREMPEEINRVLTDQISDYLFTTCKDAENNLVREGIAKEKIYFVGNIMIESLINMDNRLDRSDILNRLSLTSGNYVLLTLHRPSNVDNKKQLAGILRALQKIQKEIPIIFPAHPRTVKKIHEFTLKQYISSSRQLNIVEPINYIDFLRLEKSAAFVLTDSGGIQEETTFFNVPCLTLRSNTERPITVQEGTNQLIGSDPENIVKKSFDILSGNKKKGGKVPKFWDDRVSKRIVEVLLNK